MSNNKYKVLIVDDEANICSFIAAILESNGYQVLTAGTCLQGRLVFATHNPDLIVLDLGLPDEDGSALIRTVREAGCAAPILVLSARSDESEKIAALDLGANDYITKPLAPASCWPACARRCARCAPARQRPARCSMCAG